MVVMLERAIYVKMTKILSWSKLGGQKSAFKSNRNTFYLCFGIGIYEKGVPKIFSSIHEIYSSSNDSYINDSNYLGVCIFSSKAFSVQMILFFG